MFHVDNSFGTNDLEHTLESARHAAASTKTRLSLRWLFSSPTFSDIDKTEGARLLYPLLLVVMLGYAMFTGLEIVRSVAEPLIPTARAGLIVCIGLLYPMRRGYIKQVAVILAATLSTTIFADQFLNRTDPFPIWLIGVIASVFAAACVLGRKALVFTTIANLAAIGVLLAFWLMEPTRAISIPLLITRAGSLAAYLIPAAIGADRLLTRLRDRQRAERIARHKAEAQNAQLTRLLKTTSTVAATRQLEPALDHIVHALCDALNASDVLAIGRNKAGAFRLLASTNPSIQMAGERHLANDANAHVSEMLRTSEPVVVQTNHRASQMALSVHNQYAHWGMQVFLEGSATVCFVPLMQHGTLTGFLALHLSTARQFSGDELRLAKSYASHAAIALESARLQAEENKSAAMAERQRIARDLHDSVSQTIFGIATASQVLVHPAAGATPAVAEAGRYIIELSRSALSEMRTLIYELQPTELVTDGLRGAFTRQAEMIRQRNHLDVTLILGETEPKLGAAPKEALYRIGCEALNNVCRHARAQNITVTLQTTTESAILTISDDGAGFDLDMPRDGHFGLRTMRDRAELHGGTLTVTSTQGAGTQVQAVLPVVTRQVEEGA